MHPKELITSHTRDAHGTLSQTPPFAGKSPAVFQPETASDWACPWASSRMQPRTVDQVWIGRLSTMRLSCDACAVVAADVGRGRAAGHCSDARWSCGSVRELGLQWMNPPGSVDVAAGRAPWVVTKWNCGGRYGEPRGKALGGSTGGRLRQERRRSRHRWI